MRVSYFSCSALSSCVAVAMLAGCGGGSQPPISAPGTMPQSHTAASPPSEAVLRASHLPRETIVYAFQGGNDGVGPGGALVIDARGAIYGATGWGGGGVCYNGCGTVFKLTPSGSAYTESILYSFQGGSDGYAPSVGGLIIDSHGALYGTTLGGNYNCVSSSCGTVYKLTPTKSGWVHEVLYLFNGGSDGYQPDGGVVADSSGALYGTTYAGGTYGGGTAYKLTPAKSGYKKSTLFSFSTSGDAKPTATLLLGKRGALYGTALFGSVFELMPARPGYAMRTLHAFRGSPDGSLPYAPVIAGPGGALYGTTDEGGATSRCKSHFGCGTVYKLSPAKHGYSETVFSFQKRDGAHLGSAVLLGKDGALYGTTGGGGLETCPAAPYGCGLVFKLEAAGAGFSETVLHKFLGGRDGWGPSSPLVADTSGALFGTTGDGGGKGCQFGCGVVFRIAP